MTVVLTKVLRVVRTTRSHLHRLQVLLSGRDYVDQPPLFQSPLILHPARRPQAVSPLLIIHRSGLSITSNPYLA